MEEQTNQQSQTNTDERETNADTQNSAPVQLAPENQSSGETTPNVKDVEENKLWAFLGYLGILCLIPLLAKKDSPFAQFHAKQGLILTIAWFFAWVPLFGWILGIAAFIFWIMGIIQVFSGKMTPLPIVGDLAKKINI